jgi:hypothetical protein
MAGSVENRHASERILAFAGFTLTLVWVSVRFFKQLGVPAVLLYVACAGVALYLLILRYRLRIVSLLSSRRAHLVAAAVCILLLALSIPLHSLINRNALKISGYSYGNTDVDDAITVALDTFLDGEYPYRARTWANSRISPMPGALLLALPFHLMGDAAIQNVFWFYLLFLAAAYLMRDARYALVFWLLALALSPKIFEGQICQGSDHLANATYVALGALLLIELSRKHSDWLPRIACAAFCGITMSSRMNFLVLLPLVFSSLIRISGWRTAGLLMACAGCGFVVVTAPFYFYEPASFSPLHILSPVSRGPLLVRTLFSLNALLAGLIALLLAVKSDNSRPAVFLRNCFLVQLWLVACQLVLVLSQPGAAGTWMFVQYGFFFFPFGFLSFSAALHRWLQVDAPSKNR